MGAAGEKENVIVFFSFWRNRVVLKVERSRPIGPDRWARLETSRLDRTVHA
jgi:hypothetical protein